MAVIDRMLEVDLLDRSLTVKAAAQIMRAREVNVGALEHDSKGGDIAPGRCCRRGDEHRGPAGRWASHGRAATASRRRAVTLLPQGAAQGQPEGNQTHNDHPKRWLVL